MDLRIKHNIFSDFIKQRNIALESCINAKKCREVTPWDRVGAESSLDHNEEVISWLNKELGLYTIVNKKRHFNACMENPYNFAHVHYDDFDYIVIIYLNLPTQIGPEDGTIIVSHKESGRNYLDQQILDDIEQYYIDFEKQETLEDVYTQEKIMYESDYMQPWKWNIDCFIPMVDNKAVLFEPRYFHTERRNFGVNMTNCRLVEILYVNKGKK